MANRLSSHMDGATTLADDHWQMNSDDTSMSLLLKFPMSVQTYYEKICKNQPLARRNLIVDELCLASLRGPYLWDEKYEFVVAKVKHLRGHDISHRLEYLVIERNLHSPTRSLSSPSAKHIVSQCWSADGGRGGSLSRKLTFDTSSDSDVRKLCSLEELFRLVTIISKNSHLYSTDIDESFWFAAAIMETAQAIFPIYDDESGWFKRTFLKSILYKPQTECGRQIVAAYKADKKKNPIPTPQSFSSSSQRVVSKAPSGNETRIEDEYTWGLRWQAVLDEEEQRNSSSSLNVVSKAPSGNEIEDEHTSGWGGRWQAVLDEEEHRRWTGWTGASGGTCSM